jgi:hypothetical protein
MTPSPRPTTPLRQRMIEDMKLRNFSPHTVQAYVDRVAAFAKHFDKSPQLLGPKEVRAYLVFLVEEKRVSWSYYGQAICALRFLYRVTLGKDWVVKGVVSPKWAAPQKMVQPKRETAGRVAHGGTHEKAMDRRQDCGFSEGSRTWRLRGVRHYVERSSKREPLKVSSL